MGLEISEMALRAVRLLLPLDDVWRWRRSKDAWIVIY